MSYWSSIFDDFGLGFFLDLNGILFIFRLNGFGSGLLLGFILGDIFSEIFIDSEILFYFLYGFMFEIEVFDIFFQLWML